jgi:hypothetical protein
MARRVAEARGAGTKQPFSSICREAAEGGGRERKRCFSMAAFISNYFTGRFFLVLIDFLSRGKFMRAEEISELRRRMVAATDYSEFHHYYVANYFENAGFRSMGRPLSAPLARHFARVCLELYLGGPPKKLVAIQANLTEIREFGLVYGVLSIGGKLCSILYFDDVEQGMMSVIENMETLDTEFLQFHLQRPAGDRPN